MLLFSCFARFSQVITTHGPRKPQRLSSNANLSIDSPLHELSASAYQLNNVSTPTNSQKVCLETSFTSLQSPLEPIPLICSSSKASSTAGSLFSRSQLNSILQYDGGSCPEGSLMGCSMSAGASEATTILLGDASGPQFNCGRSKCVAFDINKSSYPMASSPSPNVLPRSILHRQGVSSTSSKKPTSLSFADSRPARKIDATHDDWFGKAPLASPETLSEISSISSRASLTLNLASSIEKYLNGVGINSVAVTDLDEAMESQMLTPKVMRRTPKISTNLSSCADDWRSVDKFKRMGKIFITSPLHFQSNSGSSENSYDSPTLSKYCTASSNENQLSHHPCSSSCPRCPCQFDPSLECCHRREHSLCAHHSASSTASDTFYSALSSLTITDSNSISPANYASVHSDGFQLPSGLLESHFPVFAESESTSLLLQRPPNAKIATTNNGNEMAFRRVLNDDSDRGFARNEALPLLAGLAEKNASSPSKFGRRKNYVYPVTASPRPSPSKRSESSV